MLKQIGFYVAAAVLTIVVALIYLLNTAAGADWAMRGLPLDDAWIHLVYARSLATEGWFYYNPDVAEAGMSSPMWVLVLAAVYKIAIPLGVSAQWVAKGTSLFFAGATAIAAYHLVKTLKLPEALAWIAGLFLLLDPNFAYSSVAGMEVTMAAFLVLMTLYGTLSERYVLAGIMMGMLVITRAEMVPAAIIIGVLPLLREYLKREELTFVTVREVIIGVKLFLPSALIGGLWALYNYSINGSLLPNTYYVKRNFELGNFNLENLIHTWQGYGQHLVLFDGLITLLTLAMLVSAGWYFIRKRQYEPGIMLLGVLLLQVYLFSITIKVSGGDIFWTFFTRRYLDFLLPLLVIVVAIGAFNLWQIAQESNNRAAVMVTPLLMMGFLALAALNTFGLHGQLSAIYSWDNENIESVDVAMGKWLNANLEADATIALTDAGAMRYFAAENQVIVDLLGLNCHQCIGRPAPELLAEFDPDYVVLFSQGITDEMPVMALHSLSPQRVTILGGSELIAAQWLATNP